MNYSLSAYIAYLHISLQLMSAASISTECCEQLTILFILFYIDYLKGTLPSPSGDTTAVAVGAFFGGAIFGAVTVVLVVGIVFGVFKLRRKCNNTKAKQERLVLFILTMKYICNIRTASFFGWVGGR